MKLRMEDFLGRQGDFKPNPRIRALDRRCGVNEDFEDAERQRLAAVDNRRARRIPATTGKPGAFQSDFRSRAFKRERPKEAPLMRICVSVGFAGKRFGRLVGDLG